jgi:hypothetical protein
MEFQYLRFRRSMIDKVVGRRRPPLPGPAQVPDAPLPQHDWPENPGARR